jgi:hypothetical protein
MTHRGGCHCGKITFEADIDGGPALECNCSICTKRGSLLWFVPRDRFRTSVAESELATYRFNTHTIAHHFCPTCGCAPFAFGTDPKSGAMAAINVRCLDDVDLSTIDRKPFDGRRL